MGNKYIVILHTEKKNKMKKLLFNLLYIFALLCTTSNMSAQTADTIARSFKYVERDSALYLDVYNSSKPNGYTVMHIYGGGFVNGSRLTPWDVTYCRNLVKQGFNVVAIDYRLGLRNVKYGKLSVLENAFYMAAEDCSAAIAYIVNNAKELKIDPSKIILEGSSAGAITALMTDYGRCNRMPYTRELPQDWKPVGVIAYSGAIYSTDGKVKWQYDQPAPTLLFHGTVDRIVPYKQIVFGKKGFFGGNALAKRFDKFNLPYCIYRYTDLGHEVSIAGPLTFDEFNQFIKQYIKDGRKLHEDITVRDDAYPPTEFSKLSLRDFNKVQSSDDL